MKTVHAWAMSVVLLLAVFGGIQAVTLEVREGNSTCIKADLSALFSITYNTSSSERSAVLELPGSATVDPSSSSCGSESSPPWLVAVFGSGHALGLSFSSNSSMYSVTNLTLQYNLSDATVFPEANSSDVVTVVSASVGIWAPVNTTYRCLSSATFRLDTANLTLSNVRLQAFMSGNDLSPNESVCLADQASTPAPPRPTTIAPVPVPTPAGPPERGNYNITQNGTVCLLAHMGLQLNVTHTDAQNKTVQDVVNVNPDLTSASGSCEANNTILVLTLEQSTTLTFNFTLNSTASKYHLSGVSLANWPNFPANSSIGNGSLNYLRSSLGHSYMCNAEQTLVVLPIFSINTFKLQVQPFGVTTTQFASAEECQIDQDQMLIPIIVGAALAGLVMIVLVAYLIGRKRSHAGYQTI
ncbi:lysosome-associated membrane glycoprotein 1a [Eucyclogobius newberryi]|uniref:lysosome-associated membrane glycoprotein 1a n=1 Tax=Eucyclogobius newberryi TaxID=166745 RepID=UPI003B58C08B